MSRRARTTIRALALLAGVAVLAATLAQALREDSWRPLSTIGWLPAVLLPALAAPRGRRACLPRLRRRPEV